MSTFCVVAEYRLEPSEGIQVVSKSLVDHLRADGHRVTVVEPGNPVRVLAQVVRARAKSVVFTHGPGRGVVFLSWFLRHFTGLQIIWVATRPDLSNVPTLLTGRATAHVVVCNSARDDLKRVARNAQFVQCYLGIDPARTTSTTIGSDSPWPALELSGAPIGLHVGHLRRNRGLDLLVEAKNQLGSRVEVVVQGSPTFEPDPGVIEELEAAGILVSREYVADLGRLYRAADLYLFPVSGAVGGAIELPLGVLEAISNQCPVLATDFGALPAALAGVDGVTLASTEKFVDAFVGIVESGEGGIRPAGLPDHLNVARVADAVLSVVPA